VRAVGADRHDGGRQETERRYRPATRSE
jgi:hypothetical protein